MNFGYPFLDEATELSGDLEESFVAAFNAEDKRPREDYVDYFQEVPVVSNKPIASIEVHNAALCGGIVARISYPCQALPNFGIWRAFQSGAYALALEPMRRQQIEAEERRGLGILAPGATAAYWFELQLGSIPR